MADLSLHNLIICGILFVFSMIHATLSETAVIQSEVSSRDKFILQNSTCQKVSGMEICERFGALQEDGHKGKNCSCICPQGNKTFGFEGEDCKCLSNSNLYRGCSRFSRISREVLLSGSNKILSLPSDNCTLELLYSREKNGSWIRVNAYPGTIILTVIREYNGSVEYSLKISNSTHFQGILFNVIIQCPTYNSTCFLLKLSNKISCPFTLPSTRAPTTTTKNVTTHPPNQNTEANALGIEKLAAIIVGSLLLFALIILLVFLWVRRKRRIKHNQRQRQHEMTENQNVRRSSEAVIFSRPNAAISQRKDSANEGLDANEENAISENSEELDYDLPVDVNHSIISDLVQKKKRSRSLKTSPPKPNQREPDKESDYYQIMNSLVTSDNSENAPVYENTNGFVKDQLSKAEAKQPSYKKIWNAAKRNKKDKKSRSQDTEGKSENSNTPQVTVTVEIPKNEGENNQEPENFYENNQAIQNNRLQHDGPPRTPVQRNSASHNNDVPEDEEVPQPPLRSTSLEKIFDEPSSNRPIPVPRKISNEPRSQSNNAFDNDLSELYENTRDNVTYTKPLPRAKR